MSGNDKTKSKLMESIRMTKAGKNKKDDAPAAETKAEAKPAEPAKAAETKPAPKAKAKASKPAPAKKAATKAAYLPTNRVWPD